MKMSFTDCVTAEMRPLLNFLLKTTALWTTRVGMTQKIAVSVCRHTRIPIFRYIIYFEKHNNTNNVTIQTNYNDNRNIQIHRHVKLYFKLAESRLKVTFWCNYVHIVFNVSNILQITVYSTYNMYIFLCVCYIAIKSAHQNVNFVIFCVLFVYTCCDTFFYILWHFSWHFFPWIFSDVLGLGKFTYFAFGHFENQNVNFCDILCFVCIHPLWHIFVTFFVKLKTKNDIIM